jgi:putative transposase
MVALTPEALRRREATARGRQGMSKARQRSRPAVGLEWGVRTLVALSDGERFDNPRHLKAAARRLRKAAQNVSRKPFAKGQQSSANRVKAVRRLAKAHHEVALARANAQHQVTARLALSYPCIAVRDLDVRGMTKSARGSRQAPGRDVKIKAMFNRAILDTAPYQLRRQLAYKTAQFGTEFRVAPKDLPSSQTCSRCGWRDPSIPLSQLVFLCGNVACGARIDREVNAARNIRDCVVPVASDSGETLNACGDGVGPPAGRGLPSVKQEGRPVMGRSSRGSDPPAFRPVGFG